MVASVWAALIMRGTPLSRRVEMFSSEAGSVNVMYMVWVFVLAGAFSAIAKETGAVDATVSLALTYLPAGLIVPGLFLATCFISLSIGTSVGTVVALTPLAVGMAANDPSAIPFFVAIVLGGAFFGDNLSFISDTTIAATRTQGCDMKDKFRANLWIVVPAAVVALMFYAFLAPDPDESVAVATGRPFLVIPYLIVIVCAISGINVTVVLLLGIVSAITTGLFAGYPLLELFGMAGNGIASMGELIIITLLAAGMLGLIKAAGGIDYLIQVLTRHIHGPRGAQAGIALLVGMVNLCTVSPRAKRPRCSTPPRASFRPSSPTAPRPSSPQPLPASPPPPPGPTSSTPRSSSSPSSSQSPSAVEFSFLSFSFLSETTFRSSSDKGVERPSVRIYDFSYPSGI